MREHSKKMTDYIRGWGLPHCLKEIQKDIVFIFDDSYDCISEVEGGYHCHDDDVKFGLYNVKKDKILFTMDFYWEEKSRAFYVPNLPRVNLALLYTHDAKYRKKGIASYYVSKLIEYAIAKKANYIYLTPNAIEDDMSLSQQELIAFYRKRSTEKMPIDLNVLKE